MRMILFPSQTRGQMLAFNNKNKGRQSQIFNFSNLNIEQKKHRERLKIT